MSSLAAFVMFIQQHKGRCHTSRTSTHQILCDVQESHTHTCECWFSALSRRLKCICDRRAATLINRAPWNLVAESSIRTGMRGSRSPNPLFSIWIFLIIHAYVCWVVRRSADDECVKESKSHFNFTLWFAHLIALGADERSSLGEIKQFKTLWWFVLRTWK